MKRFTLTFTAAVLALSSLPATALQFYPRAEIGARLQASASQRSQFKSADALQLGTRMKLALAATNLQDPLLAEATLHAGLLRLRELPPDIESRALVEQLTAYAPQAMSTPVDPDHGRGKMVPVFEIAAAARGTLRSWDLQDSAQTWSAAAKRTDRGAMLAGLQDAQAVALALRALSETELDNTLALVGDELPQPALLAALERRPQLKLYRQLLASTPQASAAQLQALSAAAQKLSAGDALALMREASAQAPLASAALLALAPLSAQHAPVRAYLIGQLGDREHGGAAAQALAADAGALPALTDILEASDDSLRQRRALLALSLHGNKDEARALLRAFSQDQRHAAELRREVAGWLP